MYFTVKMERFEQKKYEQNSSKQSELFEKVHSVEISEFFSN